MSEEQNPAGDQTNDAPEANDPKPVAAAGEGEASGPDPAAQGSGEAEEQAGPPRYQCHKIVEAVLIHRVEPRKDGAGVVVPLQERYLEQVPEVLAPLIEAQAHMAPFVTAPGWLARHYGNRDDRGVWVRYKDGYESWSPLSPFLSGYELEQD